MNERLSEILDDMNIPKFRKTDIRWLRRNLGIYNGNHPFFNEAKDLLSKEIV